MARRRQVGYVFRKCRPGPEAAPVAYHPGWLRTLRRGDKELQRYGGSDKATATEFLRKLQGDLERMELLGQTPHVSSRTSQFPRRRTTSSWPRVKSNSAGS